MPKPSREDDADRVGPPPARLKIHAHLNVSSTALSSCSDGSYRTDSSGKLSQADSRWSQDFGNTTNSGFGGGSPRSETKKGAREVEKRRTRVVVPTSMINALRSLPIEDVDPKKEVLIAEAVIRHLDKQRRDAQDGEIKAAVEDLEGSVEHWIPQVEAWKQRRRYARLEALPGYNVRFVGLEASPCADSDCNKSEPKKWAIKERLRELKEDINLLNSQDRARELYGKTIRKCAAAIQDMEAGLKNPFRPRVRAIVTETAVGQEECLTTNRIIPPHTDEALRSSHPNEHRDAPRSEIMTLLEGRSREADQTKAIEYLVTETTMNTREEEAADANSQTETRLKDAETQTTSSVEHPESVASERNHHLLILHRHRERYDELRARARSLNEKAELAKVLLTQPNNTTFIGRTGPLRDRIYMLQNDIATLLESVKLAEQDPSCKEHNMQHKYRGLRLDVALLYIGEASRLRQFDEWEIQYQTKSPRERIRRKNSPEQMSWMKPMRSQRTRSQTEAPALPILALPAPQESAENVDSMDKPQSDARSTETSGSPTSSLSTDHTLVAHAPDTSDEKLQLKPKELSVSQTDQRARKGYDTVAEEAASTASSSPVSDQSAERTLEIKEGNLNTIRLKGLYYWQQHQHLQAEIESLEIRLKTQPDESAPHIEKYRELVTRLIRNADLLHKETRLLPEIKLLTRDLSDIIGEGSATLHNLSYLEDEQKRREKQKNLVTQCQRENKDHIQPTFQLPPKTLRPDTSRRDSGYFELSPIEECFIPDSAA